ncbi:MAG: transcription antitermination factor NusB [Planctomycetaceae bacterium]|nr:transcription antitermination factor NusB [Planctomycetaceae bacterium]
MTSHHTQTVREQAYHVLVEASNSDEYAETLIENIASEREARDLIRLRYLVTTVIRRKLTIETVLNQFINRTIEPDLWVLLKLGAAQILFGASDHRHADVNETVEVARRVGKPHWCKFLNGVLRNIDRNCTNESPSKFASNVYPAQTGDELRLLKRGHFPDPHKDFAGYVSVAFSLPRWLIDRWQNRFDQEQLLKIANWFLSSSRMCLRVNLNKVSREKLLTLFAEGDSQGRPGNIATSILDIETNSVTQLPGWETGLFSVQDVTAQQAAATLNPQPGETILDLCAAPGTKTIHLAELMNFEGSIIAADVSEDRLSKVRENTKRCDAKLVETVQIGYEGNDFPAGPFDRILIDAPCTNTGVLGKRVDARWRISPADIQELSQLQLRLLTQAASHLKPGGRIVYSTCSLEPEENEQVIEQFLKDHSHFECSSQKLFLPGSPSDGGFQALLVDQR